MADRGKSSELRHTVVFSITEGVYTQVYIALATVGSAFVTRYALLLGAMPFHLGLLAAIGQLALVFQPLGIVITRRGTSRKRIIVKLATFGRALALLYGILPFLFPRYTAIWVFLLLLSIATSMHAMGTNAWIAWISDMIPERIRGRFFSWRSRYFMIVGLFIGYVFGAIVDIFDPKTEGFIEKVISVRPTGILAPEHMNVAFILVFTAAAVFGYLGVQFLKRQPERPKRADDERVSASLVTPLRDLNFRKFLIYNFWWMLALGIGSPFWQPFMIQKLQMSLVNIQVYGTISAVASILALRPWGMVIDRFGNKAAMRLAIVLGGINPLVWLFVNTGNSWILNIEAITSGIMWSGTNIVAMNFVLSIAPRDGRQVYSGILGAVSGTAMVITMLLSGILLPRARDILGMHLQPEQILFGLTGLLRWTAHIPLSWVKEPKGRPFGALLYYIRQSAKVRIGQFIGVIARNGQNDR
ncbi:MAG: MFS transporter [candidate division WOR-3 bacterium]|nr:MAG: MFS transporter [candidate division WOR-3 bacterium]